MSSKSLCTKEECIVGFATLTGCLGIASIAALVLLQELPLTWEGYYTAAVVTLGCVACFLCYCTKWRKSHCAVAIMKVIGVILTGSAIGFSLPYLFPVHFQNAHPSKLVMYSDFAVPVMSVMSAVGVAIFAISCCMEHCLDAEWTCGKWKARTFFAFVTLVCGISWAISVVYIRTRPIKDDDASGSIPKRNIDLDATTLQTIVTCVLRFGTSAIYFARFFTGIRNRTIVYTLIPFTVCNGVFAMMHLIRPDIWVDMGMIPDKVDGVTSCLAMLMNIGTIIVLSFTETPVLKLEAASTEEKIEPERSTNFALDALYNADTDMLRYV